MSNWLKQSTAVVISFGPFVSQTDGVTLKTGLVSALDNGSTGIKLSKNGGALTIRHASVTASTYDAYGNYLVTLDTTDTNTLGQLRAQFADATTNLVVWQDFMVVPVNIWDSMFGASLQKVDIDTIKTNPVVNGGTITFPTTATLASTTNITGGTITTATNLTTNNDKTGYSLTVTPPTSAQISTAVLTTQMTESYAALHAVPTLAQAVFEMRGHLSEKGIASTVLTINGIDGSTAKETFTLNSATAPTAITRAS